MSPAEGEPVQPWNKMDVKLFLTSRTGEEGQKIVCWFSYSCQEVFFHAYVFNFSSEMRVHCDENTLLLQSPLFLISSKRWGSSFPYILQSLSWNRSILSKVRYS